MAKQVAVTYAELVEILHQFHYVPDPEQSAEDHTTFRHPKRRLRIILPALKDRTPVRDVHLAVVKHFLAEADDAEAQEFDAWLDDRATRVNRKAPVR